MSLCRFGPDSDVYVFEPVGHEEGTFECCGCSLRPSVSEGPFVAGREVMLAHLERHREEGHLVPQRVLDQLRGDACPETGRPHAFDPGPGLGTGPRLCQDCGAEWEGP